MSASFDIASLKALVLSVDDFFETLASTAGASVDQVKLISCLLISYPLASLFIRIPVSQPNLRHLFNLAVTSSYLLILVKTGSAYVQLLADILVTYFLAANLRTSYMPWIVFAIIMGHLTANNVIRQMYQWSYETVDISGPQMVLTMKLTTFAWNVLDGRRPLGDLDKWQAEKRVSEYPSLLAFLGYSFYFPGFLVGPSLEYADYDSLIRGTHFKSLQPDTDSDHGRRSKLIPKGRKRVAYRKMVLGLVFLGTYVVFSESFNLRVPIQDWFAQKNILYRITYQQVCGFVERMKYYAVWTLTEGACILTGLGFTGFDPKGKSRWDGAANVAIMNIEFPPNFKILLDSWNIKTNVWLRECVYKRVTPKGKKPGFRSSMITFTASAFWHGVAGGYYLTFSFGGFVQTAQRLCRRNLRPLFLPLTSAPNANAAASSPTLVKRLYDFAGVVCSLLILNYAVTPFMLLNVHDSLLAWSMLGWYGHWMVGGALVFFYAGGARLAKKIQAKRIGKEDKARANLAADMSPGGTPPGEPAEAPVLPPLDDAAKEFAEGMELRRRVVGES